MIWSRRCNSVSTTISPPHFHAFVRFKQLLILDTSGTTQYNLRVVSSNFFYTAYLHHSSNSVLGISLTKLLRTTAYSIWLTGTIGASFPNIKVNHIVIFNHFIIWQPYPIIIVHFKKLLEKVARFQECS